MYAILLVLLLAPARAEMGAGNRVRRSSDTMTGPLTINGTNLNGYSLNLSTGIYSPAGVILSTAIRTARVQDVGGSNFFKGGCTDQTSINGIGSDGRISCTAISYPVGSGETNTYTSSKTFTTAVLAQGGIQASTGVFTSTLTVQGNAFSVGGSTFVVANGRVGIGAAPSAFTFLDITRPATSNGSFSPKGINIANFSHTYTAIPAIGAFSQGFNNIGVPTLASSGGGIGATNLGTLYIGGPPLMGSGVTATSTSTILMGYAAGSHKIEVEDATIGGGVGKNLTIVAGAGVATESDDTPGGSLYLKGGAGADGLSSGLSRGGAVVIQPGATTAPSTSGDVLLAPANGLVGVAISSPAYQLDVNGGEFIRGQSIHLGSATFQSSILATTATFSGVVYSSGGVTISSSSTDGARFDTIGNLRFSGISNLRIATGKCAFISDAGPLAGFCFDVNGNGGFNIRETSGLQVYSFRTTGQFNLGAGAVKSTFTAAGNLLMAGGVTASNGLILSSTTIPSIACNSGTGVLTPESTNQHGEFVAGAAAANCTVTFTATYPKKPKCWCNDETAIVVVRATPTTTTLKCDVAATFGGDTIQYGCQGSP